MDSSTIQARSGKPTPSKTHATSGLPEVADLPYEGLRAVRRARSGNQRQLGTMQAGVPDGFQLFTLDEGFVKHVGPLYWRVEGDRGTLGFVVQDHHMNPAGICHGGMMMTVMDMAVGFNVQLAAKTEAFSPTIQMSYDFLKPALKDQWLVSDIDFRHTTRRLGFASGLMIGPDGPVLRCNGLAKLPSANNPRFARAEGAAAIMKAAITE